MKKDPQAQYNATVPATTTTKVTNSHEGNIEELLAHIDTALERTGMSASEASRRAAGSKELIAEMRRGRLPSVTRIRSLCKILDLEFYAGPPRHRPAVDPKRLADAIAAAEHALALVTSSRDTDTRANAAAAIYDLMGEDKHEHDRKATQIVRLVETIAARQRESTDAEPVGDRPNGATHVRVNGATHGC